LMILACAGSGKTKTLERRIMHLLSTPGVSARSVLAITFSRKAATELAERVKASLNAGLVNARPHAASDVQISTFHALALRTLVDEWEAAGFPQVPHVADAREQKAMMCEVLRDWVATQSGGAGVAAALGEEAKAIRANPLIRPAIEGIVDELMEKLASAASSASRGGGSRRGGGDPDRAPFAVAHSTGHRPHNDGGPGGKEHLTSVEHSLRTGLRAAHCGSFDGCLFACCVFPSRTTNRGRTRGAAAVEADATNTLPVGRQRTVPDLSN
jgi:hypothetical protein